MPTRNLTIGNLSVPALMMQPACRLGQYSDQCTFSSALAHPANATVEGGPPARVAQPSPHPGGALAVRRNLSRRKTVQSRRRHSFPVGYLGLTEQPDTSTRDRPAFRQTRSNFGSI